MNKQNFLKKEVRVSNKTAFALYAITFVIGLSCWLLNSYLLK